MVIVPSTAAACVMSDINYSSTSATAVFSPSVPATEEAAPEPLAPKFGRRGRNEAKSTVIDKMAAERVSHGRRPDDPVFVGALIK